MREKIYLELHVNCQLLLTHFDQNWNVPKSLVKTPNMNLNENPF
jgi:hypothetical protein